MRKHEQHVREGDSAPRLLSEQCLLVQAVEDALAPLDFVVIDAVEYVVQSLQIQTFNYACTRSFDTQIPGCCLSECIDAVLCGVQTDVENPREALEQQVMLS